MRQCCRVFGIEYSQGEANLLALNIQGKREYSNEKYVSRKSMILYSKRFPSSRARSASTLLMI